MALFCVFTPTYNRGYCLGRVYKSLLRQNFDDFTWLIVDDGSTDDTETIVSSFIDDDSISIRYVKVANGGKQRAQNLAAELCEDELFMCVDSDDWLTDDALRTFSDVWDAVKSDPSIAGMISPRQIEGAREAAFPSSADVLSAWDLYESFGYDGDALHVYRTEILRQFPLPVADGEKFISEWYSVSMISKTYNVKVIHRALQIGEYLPGGYTDKARELARNNPVSYYTNKRLSIEMSKKWSNKIKNTILYLVGCHFAGKTDSVRTAPNKILAVACYLPALLLACTEFSAKRNSKTLEMARKG